MADSQGERGQRAEAQSTDPTDERFGNDESVKQCLEIMGLVLAEQRARARHLDTKTGTIAGFCATALTLNVTLGRPLLDEELGATAESVVAWFFGLAVAALGVAALIAVVGVLRPMGHDDLTEEQIDAYSDRPKVTTPPPGLRMTWLRTVTDMARSDRAAGEAKVTWSKWASLLLGVGVIAIAGQAITLLTAQ